MSAFKCSDKHMQYIANRLYSYEMLERGSRDEESVKNMVNRWIDLNIQALQERYGDSKEMYKDSKYIERINVILDLDKFQLLKALQCLRYQCSEGNVPDTKGYKELEEIIHEVAMSIIYSMPEYEGAEWEII